jgi:hypothetical protein
MCHARNRTICAPADVIAYTRERRGVGNVQRLIAVDRKVEALVEGGVVHAHDKIVRARVPQQ